MGKGGAAMQQRVRGTAFTLVGALGWMLGCSATIGRSAAPPADSGVSDVAPAVTLVVRVHLGPLSPSGPGTGFRVRAENASGTAMEVPTDATGEADLDVDPAAGPWDVTAARSGCSAVSVLGVTTPATLDVYSSLTDLAVLPPGVTVQTVTGTISNRSAANSSVVIEGFDGTEATPTDGYSLTFPYWAGAPPLQAIALEFVNDQVVNAAISAPIPRADQSLEVNIDLPSPPIAPTTEVLTVQYPAVGLTAGNTVTAIRSTTVGRFHASAVGLAVDPVGNATLGLPTNGNAVWTVSSFPGALAPDLVFATFTFAGITAPLEGWVATRLSLAGITPVYGVLNTLSVSGSSPGQPTLDTNSEGYFHSAFLIKDGLGVLRWSGYQWDASGFHVRTLPTLPTVTGGRASVVPLGATLDVCVLTTLPMSPEPWQAEVPTPLLASLLGVCTTTATPVQ